MMRLRTSLCLPAVLSLILTSAGAAAAFPRQDDGETKVAALVSALRQFVPFGKASVGALRRAKLVARNQSIQSLLSALQKSVRSLPTAEGADPSEEKITAALDGVAAAARDVVAGGMVMVKPLAAAVAAEANTDIVEHLRSTEIALDMGMALGSIRRYLGHDGKLSGTFIGMFDDLDVHDRARVGAAFVALYADPSQTQDTRRLAGEGVAQKGSKEHIKAVKALAEDPDEVEGIRSSAVYVLARLGDRSLVDEIIGGLRKRFDDVIARADADRKPLYEAAFHNQMAVVNQNLHDNAAALESYRAYLRIMEPYADRLDEGNRTQMANAWYNVACLESRAGSVDAAFQALEKSFAHGYRDFTWAQTDGDLENLRKDRARFDTLVEKHKAEAPGDDRGAHGRPESRDRISGDPRPESAPAESSPSR